MENDTALHEHCVGFIQYAFGSKPGVFPGCQPVSIERKHFPTLKSNDYVVCEKTDGERVFIVCLRVQNKNRAVLVNRAFQITDISHLNLRRTAYAGSILDAELCADGKILVFDALVVDGQRVSHLNFIERFTYMDAFCRGIIVMSTDEYLISVKRFFPVHDFGIFQDDYLPQLEANEVDGLIFTPVDCSVLTGTHETMFKWKPREKNTVDFKLKRSKTDAWRFHTQERGKDIFVQETDQNEPWFEEGIIAECELVGEENWRALKRRDDKTHANSRKVYYRTLVNLKENIEIQEFRELFH